MTIKVRIFKLEEGKEDEQLRHIAETERIDIHRRCRDYVIVDGDEDEVNYVRNTLFRLSARTHVVTVYGAYWCGNLGIQQVDPVPGQWVELEYTEPDYDED